MNLGHNDLANFYTTNFAMTFHHKYALSDLENMIPFERDIYVAMIRNHLEEEKQRLGNS